MHNKLVELILIKESNIKGLGADSRIKSKLRSYGNRLVNDSIEFLRAKIDRDTELFPEANPEPVKYFHSYIIDYSRYAGDDNPFVDVFVNDLRKRFESDLGGCSEPELRNLSRVLLNAIHEMTDEETTEYNDKIKSLVDYSESSAVYRLYVVTPDFIPDLSKRSKLSDLFIDHLFNEVLTDAILRVDSENSEDISICVVIDEDLSKIEKYNKNILSEDNLDLRPGVIKNPDGTIRAFYTENRCKYIQ